METFSLENARVIRMNIFPQNEWENGGQFKEAGLVSQRSLSESANAV